MYDDFRDWRAQMRETRHFDKPTQTSYNVFQCLHIISVANFNPALGAMLSALYPSSDDIDAGLLHGSKMHAAREARELIGQYFPDMIPAGWTERDVERIKLVVDCNSHAFGPGGVNLGLYPAAAIGLNHSCDPNCTIRVDADQSLALSTLHRIPPGQELTQSYVVDLLPGETEYTAAVRRLLYLSQNFGFICTCGRCRAALDSHDEEIALADLLGDIAVTDHAQDLSDAMGSFTM